MDDENPPDDADYKSLDKEHRTDKNSLFSRKKTKMEKILFRNQGIDEDNEDEED